MCESTWPTAEPVDLTKLLADGVQAHARAQVCPISGLICLLVGSAVKPKHAAGRVSSQPQARSSSASSPIGQVHMAIGH